MVIVWRCFYVKSKIEVGALVNVPASAPSPLRPLLPLPDGGNGVVLEIKNTNIYPGKRTGLMYKILANGKMYHLWGDSVDKIEKLQRD